MSKKNLSIKEIKNFGDLIKFERIKQKVTQVDLATRVFTTQSWLSKIENGSMPNFIMGIKLANALNIDIKKITTILKRQ